MHKAYLREVDGAVMLTVPPSMLDRLDLHAGASVELAVEGGRLIVEPASRPRYTLDELLAECDASAEITHADSAWLDGTSVGNEQL